MPNSIKNMLKKSNTLKSKNNLRKNSNSLKSRNKRQQKGRPSKNRKIRGGNPNLIHILYVLGNKTQTNQVQVIAMSKSVKNLHMFAMDLPDNLLYSNSESQDILKKNMFIDTMELDNSSSTHSWQTVSLPDIDKLIKSGVYDQKLEDISEILLHYTLDKSSKITGIVGAVYSNKVSEADGHMMTEFGNFSNALELLDNYEPLDIELEIFIKENKLSIEKKKKEEGLNNIEDIDPKTLSFDEYLNKMEKIYKDTLTPETWESEWHESIITPRVYRAYDLNDILKKCNELNLWSLFNRSLKYYGIKRIIEDQLLVKKKPLFYFIEILRSYKLNDAVEELLYDNEFLLNQFKIDNITLKQFIDHYTDKNIKSILKSLNYSVRDYKNRGISLRDIFRVTEPEKNSIKPSEMIELGFTLNDLVETKYFEYSTLKRAGFSIKELRNAGYTIKDYMNENKYLEDKDYKTLIQAGYTAKEFLEYPHTVLRSLKEYFTLKELRDAGLTLRDYQAPYYDTYLKSYDYPELIQAGYTLDEFKKSNILYQISDLKKYFTLEQLALVYPIEKLFFSYELKELSKQYTLNQLLQMYSIKEFTNSYTVNKVLALEQLATVYPLDEIIASGKYNLEQLATVYPLEQLITVYPLDEIIASGKYKLEQLATVYPLDQIFASGKYKYEDIKQFNKGDNKKLDNLLKECKKNMMRKTNLECIYNPDKKIATNPTERYPK